MLINEKNGPSDFFNSLPVVIEKDIDGIGMGVLENGIPYLTARGLSNLCDIPWTTFQRTYQNWKTEKKNKLGKGVEEILLSWGYTEEDIFINVSLDGKVSHYAFPDIVCMAFLEYQAFVEKNDRAATAYRQLARMTLKKYIYEQLGYENNNTQFEQWKYFLDRVSLLQNSVPDGYFSIFNETTGMIVDLINNGLVVNHTVVPDISVGSTWSSEWKKIEKNYNKSRIRYVHNYPDYYPQSASNPQEPYAYPNEALPYFKHWFKSEYLLKKYPSYISKKVIEHNLDPILIDIFNPLKIK